MVVSALETTTYIKIALLMIEYGKEKFGLEWPGKAACMQIISKHSTATLKPSPDESVNFDTTENLFIEGDNLEVLKLLQKSYFGKIKMIYIDPPYNTGKEFIYQDKYSDSLQAYLEYTGQKDTHGRKFSTNSNNSGRRHSRWLNMMYPRLYLARNLLRDDGVIFISIDDNEQANLKLICNEIFGEENFVGIIVIEANPGGRDYGGIAVTHDYLIAYSNSVNTAINGLFDSDKVFPYNDELGGFEVRELRNRNITFSSDNRPNLFYPFYLDPNSKDKNGFYKISLENTNGMIEVLPKKSQGIQTVWRWGKSKSHANLNTEIVGKGNVNGGYQIVEKYRKRTKIPRSIWKDKLFVTAKGSLLVKELFGNKVFSFPKPLEKIKRILEMGCAKDDLILDFFSGSSTTAHAVMELNAADGGNRKYIMVQLPEPCKEKSEAYRAGFNTIADIGKERIRRAASKIQAEKPDYKGDLGFKVFKLDYNEH